MSGISLPKFRFEVSWEDCPPIPQKNRAVFYASYRGSPEADDHVYQERASALLTCET